MKARRQIMLLSFLIGKKRLLLGLVRASSLVLFCSGAWAWQTNINGTANDSASASAVTVDRDGNVVAAGRTQNAGTGLAFTVVKFRGVDGGDF